MNIKKIAILAATGAFLVTPAVASASAPTMATGSGSSPGNATYQAGGAAVPFSFSFSAQNPNAPTGQFTFTRPDGTFTASVNAFKEQGNEAAFSGTITSGTGVFAGNAGQYAYMAVQDNGQGANATAADRIQVDVSPGWAVPGQAPLPESVYSPAGAAFPYAVTSGNIQVHQG